MKRSFFVLDFRGADVYFEFFASAIISQRRILMYSLLIIAFLCNQFCECRGVSDKLGVSLFFCVWGV